MCNKINGKLSPGLHFKIYVWPSDPDIQKHINLHKSPKPLHNHNSHPNRLTLPHSSPHNNGPNPQIAHHDVQHNPHMQFHNNLGTNPNSRPTLNNLLLSNLEYQLIRPIIQEYTHGCYHCELSADLCYHCRGGYIVGKLCVCSVLA